MRLLYNGLDVSRLLSKAEWSGDIQQAPRTLKITLLWSDTDPNYPRGVIGNIQCGDRMTLYADNGAQLFTGAYSILPEPLAKPPVHTPYTMA